MQQPTITGEAVVLNLHAANFMPRLGAAVIDAIIYVIGLVLMLMGLAQFSDAMALDVASAQAMIIVAAIVLMFGMPLLVEGFSKGRSLGKLAFGLRAVRDDGGTIRWRHALTRSLAGVFELWMMAGSIAIIASLFNQRSKRLGDMMAGTYVMITRAPKLPTPLPEVPPALRQWAEIADVGRIPGQLATQIQDVIRSAHRMHPGALQRVSDRLCHQVLHFVTPGPPPNVDPMTFLIAVMAERRNRDYRVLEAQRQRRMRDAAFLSS